MVPGRADTTMTAHCWRRFLSGQRSPRAGRLNDLVRGGADPKPTGPGEDTKRVSLVAGQAPGQHLISIFIVW
jgi:hypothetical protein